MTRNTKESALTADLARTLWRYDLETGKIFSLPRPLSMFATLNAFLRWSTIYANKEAFTTRNTYGYCTTNFQRRVYSAHRVIWLIQTGAWPTGEIDHVNGVRDDNRWSNLRCVSSAENRRNMRRSIRNTSGHTGVHWNKRQQNWQANIQVGGRLLHLGTFKTLEAAIAARSAANSAHGFTERHGTDF